MLDPWGAFVDRGHAPFVASSDGCLRGLRLAVKDNIAVAGLKWTAGLPLFAERVAEHDATCVAALRAAGAEIVGTVATDSAGFGMMTPGVINPLAADRTVGGSSGGSGAAVAAGLADIALGTDTAGSVRVPAACCGIYGLKPTFGRISVDGVTPLSTTFDHVGILAADLDPLERATRVLLGRKELRGSVIRRVGFDAARLGNSDRAIGSAVERALAWLAARGYNLVELTLPDRIQLAEIHGLIVCGEAREAWCGYWPHEAGRFSDTARRSLAYADTITPQAIAAARRALHDARASIERAFAQADVIVGPTVAVVPPPAGARRVNLSGSNVPVVLALLAETCPFNVSGHPALAVPLATRAVGIPVSVQIAAHRDREADALALARVLAGMDGPA